MPNPSKTSFLEDVSTRYGTLRRVGTSQSLYEIQGSATLIYICYSKKHRGNRTFYGLRRSDLMQLEGRAAILCFLWDDQLEPLLIPFSEFEEVFRPLTPAGDGQYKVQVYDKIGGTELYIAGSGRFNVESNLGWGCLENLILRSSVQAPDLSHAQVQTLLGAIGARKGYNVWIPTSDRNKIDWSVAERFPFGRDLPPALQPIRSVAEEIDVIWLVQGAGAARAFFEVEHSTPIYSGLLRLNDIHLLYPQGKTSLNIVSNDKRRSLFVRQVNRPTFQASGLNSVCSFLEYESVYGWYRRTESDAGIKS